MCVCVRVSRRSLCVCDGAGLHALVCGGECVHVCVCAVEEVEGVCCEVFLNDD